ncbi:uncharacterized protein LOC128555455 [Mercenaria mercenaria]|uniref:uncharacterized protein LOC128555455 n=1 Tax=Mercenaria mercenaria TaxID=6596 RepID=UPI00234F77D3|nr:uncharacterized protein LOC128555455 [Mercenaria mercenaria]
MIAAKKILRKVQRQAHNKNKQLKLENIMNSKGDDKMFSKLVREQRSTSSTLTEILTINGQPIDSPEEITKAWANYFENLAKPLQDDNFNDEYLQRILEDNELIENICETNTNSTPLVTLKELKVAIHGLNNNKAPDVYGLTAEHIKKGDKAILFVLLDIINSIIIDKKIPTSLKIGILTPVYKKGSADNPANYRGISVTPIILKILERILSTRHDEILLQSQSLLQYGFTKGKSSLTAAFIITECI